MISKSDAMAAVKTLLQWGGEDISRNELLSTPERVVRALRSWLAGNRDEPSGCLSLTHRAQRQGMVIIRRIPFTSLSDEDMVPFSGTVSVGYLPADLDIQSDRIVRLVEIFSKRVSSPDRIAENVAETLNRALDPLAVGVIIRAVKFADDYEKIGSACFGLFDTNSKARMEFFSLENTK